MIIKEYIIINTNYYTQDNTQSNNYMNNIMQDNGFGFELYYINSGYSILGGTNRAKTLEEISETCDLEELKKKIESIVTKDGLPSTILIMNMDRYKMENMSREMMKGIYDFCTSLGQRPTIKSASFGQYKAFNIETGQFYEPDEDTRLYVKIEKVVLSRDPISSFKSLIAAVDGM